MRWRRTRRGAEDWKSSGRGWRHIKPRMRQPTQYQTELLYKLRSARAWGSQWLQRIGEEGASTVVVASTGVVAAEGWSEKQVLANSQQLFSSQRMARGIGGEEDAPR